MQQPWLSPETIRLYNKLIRVQIGSVVLKIFQLCPHNILNALEPKQLVKLTWNLYENLMKDEGFEWYDRKWYAMDENKINAKNVTNQTHEKVSDFDRSTITKKLDNLW
jgi:aspartate/tyrosine/aromatic aminotransferase